MIRCNGSASSYFRANDCYQAIEHYQELLTYVKSAVTRNYSEKSINNMLDFIEKGSDDENAYHCMEKFYSQTLESFQSTNNERLWLKTNIKLARLWLDRRQYTQLIKKVRDLHRSCKREDGTDDPSKGTYALEIYALEIQMYADTRNNKRLKVIIHPEPVPPLATDSSPGPLSKSTESEIRGSSSQNHGDNTGVWRQNAYERGYFSNLTNMPATNALQKTGRKPR
jgi:hypothetical protein